MADKVNTPERFAGHRDEERFVANLRRLREERGWSQSELADRMRARGWDSFRQTTISRLEKGEQSVRIGEARGLAELLEVSLETMLAPSAEAQLVDSLRRDLDEGTREFKFATENLAALESSRMAMRAHLAEARATFGAQLASEIDDQTAPHVRVLASLIPECEAWLERSTLEAVSQEATTVREVDESLLKMIRNA